MLKMGMRVSELVNFKIQWINYKDKMVHIQANQKPLSWGPKYCSVREIPVPEELLIELKQFLGNKKTGYVFRSRKEAESHRYKESSVIHKINRITKKTFGKNLGTHIFRRTYASFLLNVGHDLIQIKKTIIADPQIIIEIKNKPNKKSLIFILTRFTGGMITDIIF